MRFGDLVVGDMFEFKNEAYRKIIPLTGTVLNGPNIEYSARCLDTTKLLVISDEEQVTPCPLRKKFEEIWELSFQPIDKALCYEFYKLGVNSK